MGGVTEAVYMYDFVYMYDQHVWILAWRAGE